jgi:uncharacterized protein YggE
MLARNQGGCVARDADTIEMSGTHEEDQTAHAADLFVRVQGQSLVTGSAALQKAKEVALIVEGLKAAGLPEAQIELVAVQAEVRSGLLSKSSHASYELKVRCANLDELPALLGVITGAKNAQLERLEWQYPQDAATEGRLLAEAAKNAQVKARAVAEALGVRLGRLVHVSDRSQPAQRHEVRFGAPAMAMRARQESVDLGMSLTHNRRVAREVWLTYSVQ